MSSQRDVKDRIDSVKNIRQITRAMEMVAAARLRRAEQRIQALRPYADALRRMTRLAAEAADNVPNIPSSRLDQHGAHDAALKAVRPRLRLRALRLDRDAAHPPAQTRPERQEKRSSTTSRRALTGPAPSWMTPRTSAQAFLHVNALLAR